jgi:hypothetical protein
MENRIYNINKNKNKRSNMYTKGTSRNKNHRSWRREKEEHGEKETKNMPTLRQD